MVSYPTELILQMRVKQHESEFRPLEIRYVDSP